MGVTKKGKNYFLDYRLPDGRRIREKVGPSKELAEDAWHKRMVQRAEGKFLDIRRPQKITLAEFAPRYLDHSKATKSPKMAKSEGNSLRRLCEVLGKRYLHHLGPAVIESYRAARRETVSPATVNREIMCLRTLLKRAVEWEVIHEHPLPRIRALREPAGRIRYLTDDEARRLIAVCGPRLRPIVQFAILTGMRKGEILALLWSDVDFRAGLIRVERTLSDRGEEGPTKTYERRALPLSKALRKVLEGLDPGTERIFTGGDPRKAFETARKRAGIKDFRFHDLRHTFASRLVMQGRSILLVKELLGHKTLAMTERYAHLAPDAKVPAMEGLGEEMDTIWTQDGTAGVDNADTEPES